MAVPAWPSEGLEMTHLLATAVALGCTALAVLLTWRAHDHQELCGFELPGSSPLFGQQSASLYLDDSGGVMWPIGAWRQPLRMYFLADAIDALDAGRTAVPQLEASGLSIMERSLNLRREMVPHVVRGVLNRTGTGAASAALAALGRLRGEQKVGIGSRDGLVERYFGGGESRRTLDEYLASTEGNDHWVSCVLSELEASGGADQANGAAASGLDAAAASWLDGVASVLLPLALLGLRASRVDDLCIRVTRTHSRIPVHYDAGHNTLVQIGDGSRRVLLLMPDNADRLYAEAQASSNGRGMVSRVDFRRVDLSAFPRAEGAVALPLTLEAGDVLHIPAGWWHYVESSATTGGDAGGAAAATPSVALNLFTVADDGLHDRGGPVGGAPEEAASGMPLAQAGASTLSVRRPQRLLKPEKAWIEVPCPAAA